MVDLILTKSISRFGRNTLESLRVLQELNELDVDVYFELEDMHLREQQMQFALSVFCVFAQEESESRSRNIRWGIQHGFRTGSSGYAEFVCYGYQLHNGKLAIKESEAAVVRQIFELRAVGTSLGKISEWLYAQGIRSPNGRPHWSRETIRKMLMNEKYTGDILLQKSYVADLFSGRQVKNHGEQAKYLIENHHPAIISRGLFNRAQAKSS